MIKILLTCVAFICSMIVSAQPSQAEMEKIKEAQRAIEKMKNDPKMKDLANKLPNIDSLMKLAPQGVIQQTPTTSESKTKKTDAFSGKLPAKNSKALAALPKKNLSKQELVQFLSSLYADLQKKLSAADVKGAATIISKLNQDISKIANAGVIAWYKKAPAQAALLLSYAASKSPDDNTLNNCGAILNLCGLEEKAIPILKYVYQHQPENSTLLNNLGQAFAGLGAVDSASYYLMGCIKRNSTHPEACATEAYIEYERGNIAKATQLAEQAIKGGYGTTIGKFYKKIKKDARLYPLLQNNLSDKKFFDLNGFHFPDNCKNWEEAGDVYARQQSLLKKIDALEKQMNSAVKQIVPTDIKNTHDALAWSLSQNYTKGPLATVAQAVKSDLDALYLEVRNEAHIAYITKMTKITTEEIRDRQDFSEKYIPLFKANEKNPDAYAALIEQQCKEKMAIDNKYFLQRATLTDRYRDEWLEKDILHYNNMVFLETLSAPSDELCVADAAAYALVLISKFKSFILENCNPAGKPNCAATAKSKKQDENNMAFNPANCPFNIEVPFVVGKVAANCREFNLEVGEGLIMNFKKDFVSRESTIAIGVGVNSHGVDLPESIVKINDLIPTIDERQFTPVEFTAKEQFYIKFDRDNQPIDVGMLWEAEIDARGVNAPEMKAGYTIGVNSGWNFEPGILESAFGERSSNPNLNIYGKGHD